MAISLYEASIPSYLQVLSGVGGFLDKARKHFEETGVDLPHIVETRLYPDMHPFRYQVQAVVRHSLGAVTAMKNGELSLGGGSPPAHDYAGLQALVADARGALTKLTPEEIDGLSGKDVVFVVPNLTRVFTTEGFLLSFSLPNLHFHATTAYDILRMKGAPLGKRDYMGTLRLKG
jgi:hypothetical protein